MNVTTIVAVLCVPAASAAARAQGSGEELAKQLSNSVTSLITLPFQLDWDEDCGQR